MNVNKLQTILKSFQDKKVLVIGDIMVDHYLWGTVERISPEAPVPVVDVYKEEYRLGGAANVALNIKALGAEPYLIGIAGNDRYHPEICALLSAKEVSSDYIKQDSSRPTTLKSRILAHSQHVIRIDFESRKDIEGRMEDEILSTFDTIFDRIDCIIMEDYNKGLLTPKIIETIIKKANEKGILTAVDPKFKNFFTYRNCTLFKPNFVELQKNTGTPIENDSAMDSAANKVMNDLNSTYLIVTRGEKGLTIYQKDKDRLDIPTFAREIYDVSGAGDTVISSLALGLCCNLNIAEAATIANHAAGAVCSKIGIQPAYPEDIIKSFKSNNSNSK